MNRREVHRYACAHTLQKNNLRNIFGFLSVGFLGLELQHFRNGSRPEFLSKSKEMMELIITLPIFPQKYIKICQ